jgi:iron complex outermembrane recepter protein
LLHSPRPRVRHRVFRRPSPSSVRYAAACVALVAASATTTATAQDHDSGTRDDPPPAIVPPTAVTRVAVEYPASELPTRTAGQVVLAVSIDDQGQVTDVAVVAGLSAATDAAAIAAARQWRFTPALQDGAPRASKIRLAFLFEPPPSASPAAAPPTTAPTAPSPAAPAVPTAPTGPTGPTGPVSAAAPAAAATSPASPPAAIDVQVRGRRHAPARGASDFDLRVDELARVPRQNAADFLKLAPGILLTNEGGDGHAEQVFLRGFDAREGQDIEFTVGGVPINESGNLHGNGYADTHFIIPELIESLRVLEGPFDPHQGNYAVAGSADYQLGLAQRGLTLKYTTGSFGSKRALFLWGPEGESNHTFGGAEIATSDGFGQNRDSQRASAMSQYEGRLGDRGSYRLAATAYATNYHTAGVIRQDDYDAGRKGFFDTYDPHQGGSASRFSLSGDLESHAGPTTFTQQVFVIARSMRLRENFTGFLLDVQTPLQNPHPQRGDLLDLDVTERTIGARGSARLRGTAFQLPQELELGYFARGDSVDASQQRIEAATNHPYLTEADLVSELGDIGLYADADLRPWRFLSLRGGVRADLFTFDVNDLCAVNSVSHPSPANPPGDASCLDQQGFGAHREPNQRSTTGSTALLPRASLLLGPIADLTLSLSYGTGVRSIDPSYITQDIKTPFASVRAYEAGLAYARALRAVSVVARTVLFQTHVDKDLIFSETAGRNVLGIGTTRTGWLGALRLTGSFFDESANLTVTRSSFDDTHLLVPYVPDLVFRSDTAFFRELPWWTIRGRRVRGNLGIGVTYVGPRALPYGERSDPIFVVDGSTALAWSHYELGLSVTNLLDRRYRLGEFNYASDFRSVPDSTPTLVPVRHFTAGAPRALFATFAINFGGA